MESEFFMENLRFIEWQVAKFGRRTDVFGKNIVMPLYKWYPAITRDQWLLVRSRIKLQIIIWFVKILCNFNNIKRARWFSAMNLFKKGVINSLNVFISTSLVALFSSIFIIADLIQSIDRF